MTEMIPPTFDGQFADIVNNEYLREELVIPMAAQDPVVAAIAEQLGPDYAKKRTEPLYHTELREHLGLTYHLDVDDMDTVLDAYHKQKEANDGR